MNDSYNDLKVKCVIINIIYIFLIFNIGKKVNITPENT